MLNDATLRNFEDRFQLVQSKAKDTVQCGYGPMVHMVDIDAVGMVQVHSVNGGEIDDGDEKVLGVMHSQ